MLLTSRRPNKYKPTIQPSAGGPRPLQVWRPSCLRQRDGPARPAHAPWHWLRFTSGFLLHLRLNTLYVRLFGVLLHRPSPMTLLPPRLAIALSAGIVGALLPSHTFPALVLCVLLANLATPCAVAVLFC